MLVLIVRIQLRQVSPRAPGSVRIRPGARSGCDVQRFSAAQVDSALQTFRWLISVEITAPVAKLVTAHNSSGSLCPSIDSSVVVRTAGTLSNASKVLTAVSPVPGSRCRTLRRSMPSALADSCVTYRSARPKAVSLCLPLLLPISLPRWGVKTSTRGWWARS